MKELNFEEPNFGYEATQDLFEIREKLDDMPDEVRWAIGQLDPKTDEAEWDLKRLECFANELEVLIEKYDGAFNEVLG